MSVKQTFLAQLFSSFYGDSSGYSSKRLSKKYTASWYLEHLRQVGEKKAVYTEEVISTALGGPVRKAYISSILSFYGKPKQTQSIVLGNEGADKSKRLVVELLQYKKMMGGKPAVLHFHFYRGQLFLYTCTFTKNNVSEDTKVLDLLKDKYTPSVELSRSNDFIIDSDNQVILFSNSFELTLKYIDVSSECFLWLTRNKALAQVAENQKAIASEKKLYKAL